MKIPKLILNSSLALSIVLASAALPLSALASSTIAQVVMSAIPAINPGGTVTITGTSTDSEVIVKVIRPTGSIVYFNIVKVINGAFSDSFVLGTSESVGIYKVVVGQGDTVDTEDLIVTASPTPPMTGTPGTGTPGTGTPGTETPGTETPGTDTPVTLPVTPPVTPPVTDPATTPGVSGSGSSGSTSANIVTPANVEVSPAAVTSNTVTGPDGKVSTTVTVDNKYLSDAFTQLKDQDKTEESPVIAVRINDIMANGNTSVSLPASLLLEGMKSVPSAVIKIFSGNESYALPLQVLDLNTIAQTLGTDISSVILHINIAVMGTDIEKLIQASAGGKGAFSLGHSVDFSVTAEGNGKTVALNNFGTNYVERSIVYSQAIDPLTSTGILYNPANQEISFVPTIFVKNADGTTQATIKRNGNSIYSVVTSSKSFTDIKGHWAKADIELLASKMVVSGTTATNFAPDHNITRAEFAALLVRSLALTSDATAATFNDVQASDWFAGSIGAAVKAKLVSGYEDGSFKPNAPITREQMTVMIAKAITASGKTVSSPNESLNKFSDNSKISNWAKDSVSQSVQAGIISGMTDTTFVPLANATRAQAAVMLKRFLQYSQFIN